MVRCCVLHSFIHSFRPLRHRPNHLRVRLDMITTLLRAGARLDSIHRPRPDSLFNNPAQLYSALYVLEQGRVDVKHYPYIAQNEHYIKAKELIVGIQEDGSFKRFMRRPHRSVLRLRSLFARGRATPPCAIRCRRMRCYGAARQDYAMEFLVKLGDNGIVWNILSFWRASN